jgi:hypothetical protein
LAVAADGDGVAASAPMATVAAAAKTNIVSLLIVPSLFT